MIEQLQTIIMVEIIIVLLMYIITWISSLFYEEPELKTVLTYEEFKELLKDDKDDKN